MLTEGKHNKNNNINVYKRTIVTKQLIIQMILLHSQIKHYSSIHEENQKL